MSGVERETAQERRVWELLTRDFYWEVPANHPVKVHDESGEFSGRARLQIFELALTTILAHMRPEFAWWVTQNRPDKGVDFIGVQQFLDDSDLGIAAAIKVGGQCKKRTTVDEVLKEIAGSLLQMAEAVNPTFFVVALSARVSRRRLDKARQTFEHQCHRHCHILDRPQIEGLLCDYFDVLTEILQEALSEPERNEVLSYFRERGALTPGPSVDVDSPSRVLAGVPFRVDVNVRWTLASSPAARLWWRPRLDDVDGDGVILITPIGADGDAGVALVSESAADDPLRASCTVELVTYTVGRVDIGDVLVGLDEAGPESAERAELGAVEVIETMRPRFFDRPYRAGLARLSDAYDQALAGIVASVGVVGAGGSGKSRMCEEFALDKRRRGCGVVTAKQAKTHEAPHRILADMLAGLAPDGPTAGDAADNVIRAVEHYDPTLATRAAPAIRSVFGTSDSATADTTTEQSVVSALLLLVVVRSRRAPLIVHLQDLHWCSGEVLLLLEHLVWQLSQVMSAGGTAGRAKGSGVLFVFEGRVRESGDSGGEIWSSVPFEAFLQRTESPVIICSSFTDEDGRSFARLLFEDRHNAHRLVADDLLLVQRELIDRVHQSAGGNPFHTLEQVRLLKELGVLGKNPKTGLLFMIRPEPVASVVPDSVFAAIQLRWQYLRERAPALALLLWASALLEDQVPALLFHRLWRKLAPDVSLRDVDGTDILWTGDGTAHEVVFRHENYFESLRRFTVPEVDRRRVVDAYCDWYSELRRPSPADRFRWARAMLELPDPDISRARALLVTALNSSRKDGDLRLARRILAFYLDLSWNGDERSSVKMTAFLRHCDHEIELCRELLGTDRDQATRRFQRLRQRIDARLEKAGDVGASITRDGVNRRHLTAETVHAQVLFNDRRPAKSAEIAGHVVDRIRAHNVSTPPDIWWESLEMEALYTQSCAQALSGDFRLAVQSSKAAAAIATRSQSPLARKVVSTYGSILLSEDPEAGEALLRGCLATWPDDDSSDAFLVHVHLSMALVLQAYRCLPESERRRTLLAEARERNDPRS